MITRDRQTTNGIALRMSAVARVVIRSRFIRSAMILMTGTAVAQALLIVAAPLLSRLYDPAAFGIFGLYTTSVGVIATLAHGRYAQAIVLPKEDRDAGALFWLGQAVTVGLFVVMLAAVALAGHGIARLLNTPGVTAWLWWVPVAVLVWGVCDALELWATRRRQFWSISLRRMARSTGQLSVQSGAGVAGWGSTGLLAGSFFGQVVETATLAAQVARRDRKILAGCLSRSRMRHVAAEYRMFPVYGAPQALLNELSQGIPTYVLASFFGASTVGLFAMGTRVLLYPASFLNNSLKQVLLQGMAEAHLQGRDIRRLFRRLTFWMIAVVAVPTVVVAFVAPGLFRVVLGEQWREAGVFARWLVLWVACVVVNTPAATMLVVLKKQRSTLLFDLCLLVARVLAVVIPALLFSATVTIAAYALVGVAFNVFFIVWADRIAVAERRRLHASGGPVSPTPG